MLVKKYLENHSKAIQLKDGRILDNSYYGKYQPNLTILFAASIIEKMEWGSAFQFTPVKANQMFNISFDGTVFVSYGNYFVSKKGTNVFEILPKEKAKHVLIKIEWGRSFNTATWGIIPEEIKKDVLYYRRASSNGGGQGSTYLVMPKDWKYKVDINDL